MSKLFVRSALAALAFALPSVALACDDEGHAAKAEAKPVVKTVTVTQLAELQQAKKATVVDANSQETRAKYGTIPGAVLLTSVAKFDAAKELPAAKDSKLVFYCANTHCPASHTAAERALTLGYTDVSVLPDGIAGWKAAGKPTAVPRS
jgi:rhodanese-related sulfurtransferase